jgi:outer membrane protein assembly factor BamE (lipoprotein component of BamABCDE complex)
MFLTVFLSNCQKNKIVKTHGIFYLQNRAVLLKVQSSNRNDVIKILGKPHSKPLHEQNTWIYIERTRTKGKLLKLGRNVLLNNNVLVLEFDKYGILEEKLFYNKKKMNEYKFAKAETENIVKRGSFVQSFVNSLRQKMRANAKK